MEKNLSSRKLVNYNDSLNGHRNRMRSQKRKKNISNIRPVLITRRLVTSRKIFNLMKLRLKSMDRWIFLWGNKTIRRLKIYFSQINLVQIQKKMKRVNTLISLLVPIIKKFTSKPNQIS